MQNVSYGNNLHEVSVPFYEKKIRKISSICRLVILLIIDRVIKVNELKYYIGIFRSTNVVSLWKKATQSFIRTASSKKVPSNAQNAQIHIITRMRKVSSGPLLSIYIFCSIR